MPTREILETVKALLKNDELILEALEGFDKEIQDIKARLKTLEKSQPPKPNVYVDTVGVMPKHLETFGGDPKGHPYLRNDQQRMQEKMDNP